MHLYWKNLEMFIFLSSKATHIGLPYTYPRIFYLEFTGLFEIKFHLEYSVDKIVLKYDIIFGSLDRNGHCPYIVLQNMFG